MIRSATHPALGPCSFERDYLEGAGLSRITEGLRMMSEIPEEEAWEKSKKGWTSVLYKKNEHAKKEKKSEPQLLPSWLLQVSLSCPGTYEAEWANQLERG